MTISAEGRRLVALVNKRGWGTQSVLWYAGDRERNKPQIVLAWWPRVPGWQYAKFSRFDVPLPWNEGAAVAAIDEAEAALKAEGFDVREGEYRGDPPPEPPRN